MNSQKSQIWFLNSALKGEQQITLSVLNLQVNNFRTKMQISL